MTQHVTFLEHLKRVAACKRKRNHVLQHASQPQINAVRNVCHNLCQGKLPLKPSTQRKLYPHRKTIRDLANTKKLKSLAGARQRLIQHGGFLPILLPAILSLLSTVGGRALSKAIGV